MKKIIIISGPNGAGKTTYANTLLRSEFETMCFINADHIASQISPSAPELAAIPAARRMIGDLDNFADRYRDLVDSWLLFDSWETPPRLMDWSES